MTVAWTVLDGPGQVTRERSLPCCLAAYGGGCDPFWGCYVVGNAQYSNQFDVSGGIMFRF